MTQVKLKVSAVTISNEAHKKAKIDSIVTGTKISTLVSELIMKNVPEYSVKAN